MPSILKSSSSFKNIGAPLAFIFKFRIFSLSYESASRKEYPKLPNYSSKLFSVSSRIITYSEVCFASFGMYFLH